MSKTKNKEKRAYRKTYTERMTQLGFMLPVEMNEKIVRAAARGRVPVSLWMRQQMERIFENEKPSERSEP